MAVAECGEGRVGGVRVEAVSGGGMGPATQESDFVCRRDEFDHDTVHNLANDTCGEFKVAGTTVQYDRFDALRSVGFQCRKEGS